MNVTRRMILALFATLATTAVAASPVLITEYEAVQADVHNASVATPIVTHAVATNQEGTGFTLTARDVDVDIEYSQSNAYVAGARIGEQFNPWTDHWPTVVMQDTSQDYATGLLVIGGHLEDTVDCMHVQPHNEDVAQIHHTTAEVKDQPIVNAPSVGMTACQEQNLTLHAPFTLSIWGYQGTLDFEDRQATFWTGERTVTREGLQQLERQQYFLEVPQGTLTIGAGARVIAREIALQADRIDLYDASGNLNVNGAWRTYGSQHAIFEGALTTHMVAQDFLVGRINGVADRQLLDANPVAVAGVMAFNQPTTQWTMFIGLAFLATAGITIYLLRRRIAKRVYERVAVRHLMTDPGNAVGVAALFVATTLDPKAPGPLHALGRALTARGRMGYADKIFRRAYKHMPTPRGKLHFALAAARAFGQQTNGTQQTIDWLERCQRRDPSTVHKIATDTRIMPVARTPQFQEFLSRHGVNLQGFDLTR